MKTTKKAVRERRELLVSTLLPLASGILFALPLLFPFLWFLVWIAAAPMYLALRRSAEEKRPVQALLSGLILGFSFAAVSYSWIPFFLREADGGFPAGWLPSGVFAVLCLFFAAVHGAVSLILSILGGRFLARKQPFAFALLSACLSMLAERLTWFAVLFFSEFGLPWNRIALAFAETPVFLQTVPLFGSLFLSGFSVLIGCLLGEGLRKKRKAALRLIPVGTALLLVFACFGFGKLCLSLPGVKGQTVQTAVWSGSLSYDFGALSARVAEEAALNPADLTVLPYRTEAPAASGEPERLAFDAKTVLIFRETPGTETALSAAFRAARPDGTRVDGSAVSNGTAVLPDTEAGSVGVLTGVALFEPSEASGAVRAGANLLCVFLPGGRLNGTAAARQVSASAVLRAAECGRDLILQTERETALISRRGTLLSRESAGTERVHFAASRYTDETPYSRFGDGILLCFAAATSALVLLFSVFRKRKKAGGKKKSRES